MRVAVTTKRCGVCREEKALDLFHRAAVGLHGRQSKCIGCAKRTARARYVEKRDAIIKLGRKYREQHREDIAAKNRNRYSERRDDVLEAQRARRERRPDQRRASDAVRKAVASGRLQRPGRCACGAPHVEAHHESYERDRWLDVDWLCRRCHARRHGEERAA